MKAFGVALLVAVLGATTAQAQTRKMGEGNNERPQPQANQAQGLDPRQDKQFPVGASWIAISLNGKPLNGERPSFTLDKQFRARGFSGCNNFSATAYPLREQGIAVGPFALTKKTCAKPVMDLERSFLTTLRTARKWEADGRGLVIKSEAGELRFERVL